MVTRDELRSQLCGFLCDTTSNADGDAWDHDRLRGVVARLVKLPAMTALYEQARRDARADGSAVIEEESA